MATKPGAKNWIIKEQIIEDAVTGLVFKFEVHDNGGVSMYVYGNLELGNRRDFAFKDGELVGTGSLLVDDCPTFIREHKK